MSHNSTFGKRSTHSVRCPGFKTLAAALAVTGMTALAGAGAASAAPAARPARPSGASWSQLAA
jgi:hypothetical protein